MIRAVDRATLNVYDRGAARWQARRTATQHERAAALARRTPEGRPRVDLGCGPGMYFPYLGAPVVGFDASRPMLELAARADPGALLVQGDLAALPFRDGSLFGSWSRASHLHVRKVELPAALADLHRSLAVGASACFDFLHGDNEGTLPSDDFPGRFFAEWREGELLAVLEGAGFDVDGQATNDEWIRVEATRGRTLPDHVGPEMRLLVCGLNPSVYAADMGVGYGRPGNRFWPAALAAGVVTRDRDPRHALAVDHVGMTDLVKRATTSASALTRDEYRHGAARVERLVRWLRPRAVCFVGLTGWRAAVDRAAMVGEQPAGFGGTRAYVMPNTSGINAHATIDDLTRHLATAAALADRE
jgi:TDG/mug DNA glycosylase family protein